ncbi:MAG: LLM class flavin-dependent oxidoreductase [Ardenticatenaceae bacterium]|nr:LLM class flavin-dependent oxidoreductase [Ardenticatenaceae bacterium]
MIEIRSPHLTGAEISWFAPICSDDYEFLGVPNGRLRSNFAHTANILQTADKLGYRNILCPSSYQVGQDTLTFAAAVAPMTEKINLLTAVRCGEIHPAMLARAIATLDHILEGRLTVNIISSPMPGENLDSASRYQRSREVIQILKQAWTQDYIDFSGEFYNIQLSTTDPVKPYQQNGGPLLYFGGYSPDGKDLCAEHCDVYLMWPDTEDNLRGHMEDLTARAAKYGRKLDYGLRVHMIVRETEAEARAAADRLVSKLDDQFGSEIRNRALDAKTYGVALQAEARAKADDEGYAEPHLWTGIGRARSGCGMALVGSPDQILAKIKRYMDMGIRAFIFSGYPHLDECQRFAQYVLPQLETISMPIAQGRQPAYTPATPLGTGQRV